MDCNKSKIYLNDSLGIGAEVCLARRGMTRVTPGVILILRQCDNQSLINCWPCWPGLLDQLFAVVYEQLIAPLLQWLGPLIGQWSQYRVLIGQWSQYRILIGQWSQYRTLIGLWINWASTQEPRDTRLLPTVSGQSEDFNVTTDQSEARGQSRWRASNKEYKFYPFIKYKNPWAFGIIKININKVLII